MPLEAALGQSREHHQQRHAGERDCLVDRGGFHARRLPVPRLLAIGPPTHRRCGESAVRAPMRDEAALGQASVERRRRDPRGPDVTAADSAEHRLGGYTTPQRFRSGAVTNSAQESHSLRRSSATFDSGSSAVAPAVGTRCAAPGSTRPGRSSVSVAASLGRRRTRPASRGRHATCLLSESTPARADPGATGHRRAAHGPRSFERRSSTAVAIACAPEQGDARFDRPDPGLSLRPGRCAHRQCSLARSCLGARSRRAPATVERRHRLALHSVRP